MLSRRRLREWLTALRVAKNTAGRLPWLTLLRAILSGVVPRAVWRERMRFGCYQCPVFNLELHTCRGVPKQFAHMGCDCYVVFEALFAEPYAGGCWGRAVVGGMFGWGAYRWRSRWEKLTSPIRFLLRR